MFGYWWDQTYQTKTSPNPLSNPKDSKDFNTIFKIFSTPNFIQDHLQTLFKTILNFLQCPLRPNLRQFSTLANTPFIYYLKSIPKLLKYPLQPQDNFHPSSRPFVHCWLICDGAQSKTSCCTWGSTEKKGNRTGRLQDLVVPEGPQRTRGTGPDGFKTLFYLRFHR